MRQAKFSLHFAMGQDGEFGKDGGLPWGSYPSELEFFWDSMKVVKEQGRIILVGRNTWESLTTGVKKRLVDIHRNNIFIIDREYPLEHVLLSLPEGVHYACIGGAYLLNHIMLTQEVDQMYFSIISNSEPVFPEADVFLDFDLVEEVASKLEEGMVLEHDDHNEFSAVSFVKGN